MEKYPEQLALTLEITPSIIRHATPSRANACIIALAAKIAARLELRDEPILASAWAEALEIACGPGYEVLYRASMTPALRQLMWCFDTEQRVQPQSHRVTLRRVA